jgi:Ulp1 family protease
MVLLARRQGHLLDVRTDGWTARPVSVSVSSKVNMRFTHPNQIEPLQTNSYDCGVWVLVCIASVLRGYHVTGLQEGDMAAFRSMMYRLVSSLPLA